MTLTKERLKALAGLLTEVVSDDSTTHGFRLYLDSRNNRLPADEYNEHRNFLKEVFPLVKKYEALQRAGRFEDKRRFTPAEKRVLNEALQILQASLVPIVLIEKEDDEEIIFLDEF